MTLEKRKEYSKKYYERNKEKCKANWKKYREEHKEELKLKNKQYRETHKEQRKDYDRKRKKEDEIYKLTIYIRNSINNIFRGAKGFTRSKKAEEILGCTTEEFVEYLQKLFKEGMTLENHGEWHIDHIKPLSSAKTKEELIKLNHYTNLQPLWASENMKKGKKIL